eukprot:NODE_2_length_91304_cov_0.692462.p16 type:complete len:439 gc:universal NODE_2_length_91304_cov_0.692462:58525-59841(+)
MKSQQAKDSAISLLSNKSYQEYKEKHEKIEDDVKMYVIITTYLNYLLLIGFGHLRDLFGKIFKSEEYSHLKNNQGYAPLVNDFSNFYIRRLYRRIRDCFNRPIASAAGRFLTLKDRETVDYCKTFQFTGLGQRVLNLSSYNYLGFAETEGKCADFVRENMMKGLGAGCSRSDLNTKSHADLEKLVADYMGTEDSIVISMGFATNSTVIPALVGKGALIISDELNHSSLVTGARLSGATIKVFEHNNPSSLEEVLKDSISQGQPRTHRPWRKILVVVEGLYSMEGSIVNLKEIVALKQKYKFYLYLDEAHSIGALGPTGRGVCEHLGVNPKDVDILMGTFTKSFGAAGGYIAGSKLLTRFLRQNSHGMVYSESMPLPVVHQVHSALYSILSSEGQYRINQLHENSKYFYHSLKNMGFVVLGEPASPVIPLLLFNTSKLP